MTSLTFYVHGRPAPQGSKRHVGKGIMVEQSKNVAPWRIDVKHAALDAIEATGGDWTPAAGPVTAHMNFTNTRPKSHFRTGKNAHLLRDDAPEFVTSRAAGDLDKLVRSTSDALVSAGVIADDSLIAVLFATHRYADGNGAQIHIANIEGARP